MARKCLHDYGNGQKRAARMPRFVEPELDAIWEYIAFGNLDAGFLEAVLLTSPYDLIRFRHVDPEKTKLVQEAFGRPINL
jgi:hypothetical protein